MLVSFPVVLACCDNVTILSRSPQFGECGVIKPDREEDLKV